MTGRIRRRRGLARIYGIPAVLAAASLAGLIAGLNGDGLFDLAAWIGVGLPLIAIAAAWRRRTLPDFREADS